MPFLSLNQQLQSSKETSKHRPYLILPYLQGEQPEWQTWGHFDVGPVCIPDVTKVTLTSVRLWQTTTGLIAISYIAPQSMYTPSMRCLACIVAQQVKAQTSVEDNHDWSIKKEGTPHPLNCLLLSHCHMILQNYLHNLLSLSLGYQLTQADP